MKLYEVLKCRREALGLSIEDLAIKSGCQAENVKDCEQGNFVPIVIRNQIKETLYQEFKNLSPVEHYRARILELGMEIKIEDDPDWAMEKIAHMMIELGKLQGELTGYRSDYNKRG